MRAGRADAGTRPIRALVAPGVDEALFIGAALDEQRARMLRGREDTQRGDPHDGRRQPATRLVEPATRLVEPVVELMAFTYEIVFG